MSKEEYLKQLQKYLKKLPKQDYEDAMEYFIEYFEETDEAGAQELMKELGTPKEAARDLISNLLDKKIEEQEPVFGVEDKKVEKDKKSVKMEHFLDCLTCDLCSTDWGTACFFCPCCFIIFGFVCGYFSPMCVYFWAFILFGRRQTGDSWYFSNSVFNIRICAYKWKWNFFCRSCNS